MPERRLLNLTRLGWGLAVPVLVLAGLGLACIHATDRGRLDAEWLVGSDRDGGVGRGVCSQTGIGHGGPALHDAGWLAGVLAHIGPFTARQLLYLVGGVALMLIALVVSYQKLGRYAYAGYVLTLALLVLLMLDRVVDLPFVPVQNNARRWIAAGPLSLQPSEFMKLFLVLTLARYLRFRKSYRQWYGLLPPLALTLVPMLLILQQPNLGTTLMLLPVLFAMLFVAGARLRHLAWIVVLGGATLPLLYFFGMKDYQRARVQVMFRQGTTDERWHMAEGYQLRQSKIALGTGGLFGTGYSEGMFVQHDLLPEEHNDFIFAIIGHQWGLAGGVLVLVAYSVIVLVGIEIATVTNDPFGRLIAIGVIVMIVVQALLNICMNIGLAPITGMTLPFVSYGGSSLWANFLALGLLVNVAQRRPMLIVNPPFEHREE